MLKYLKIGTLIKWVIRPGVWAYDKVWGTDMMNCEVCADREKYLNSLPQKAYDKARIWLTNLWK